MAIEKSYAYPNTLPALPKAMEVSAPKRARDGEFEPRGAVEKIPHRTRLNVSSADERVSVAELMREKVDRAIPFERILDNRVKSALTLYTAYQYFPHQEEQNRLSQMLGIDFYV